MNFAAFFPGKYIQGTGAILKLESLINQFGKNAIVLASKSARNYLPAGYLSPSLSSGIIIEPFSGECNEEMLQTLAERIRDERADIMVGMGGGKAIDTAKIAADRAGIPVIVVPTIASTDAPCSGCAVTYTKEGVFEKVHYQKLNPAVVLVDMDIIVEAPVRFLVAGMGDALATWFEARSCMASGAVNECGGLSTMAGQSLAKLCYDILLEHGLRAKLDCEAGVVSTALNRVTEANILLSGIGFESGGLASAHAIHNGLTLLPETHNSYHGEKVAFGLLAGLIMTGSPDSELNTVYDFCRSVGLPVTLSEIGINKIDRENLMKVAVKSAERGSSIHNEQEGVTAEMVYDAIIKADDIGRRFYNR